MKAAAQVVVDAAGGHLTQRERSHLEGILFARSSVVAQQEVEGDCARKLWSVTEPAVARFVTRLELGIAIVQQGRFQAGGALRVTRGVFLQLASHGIARSQNLIVILLPS